MIDWSQFTTTFSTPDKLYHFIGSAALFRFLLDWLGRRYSRLAVACTVAVMGIVYEFYQLLNGQWFDFYDLTANCVGIGLAWAWVWIWTR
ncbi:hypothetical protein [Candidatus Magnetobacterium casense]|uniref:VanZ-like domain-containing protein n=1 Tax=Candidatus Magnetobacterium casense TaxID=1455061 RepID=A0ABS6RXJ3_9BACT|nr:hypothetical protein [Candidatus Magnetobacterium casensis]MBV6341080.1 hypothetical protein [Candidatus Magnetobacterium casensis]